MPEAWVFDAIRTPRAVVRKGTSALAHVKPVALVGRLLGALLHRGLDPAKVDDVILGCSTQVGDQGANIAKAALGVEAWPREVPAQTINRLCISGLEAVAIAAAKVASGQCDVVVAGGVESMSRVPMMADKGAWFADPEVAAKTRFVHMGVSADIIATLDGRTREELDAVALRSHARAMAAPASRLIDVGEVNLDDGAKPVTAEKLAAFSPAFADFVTPAVAMSYPQLAVKHLHTVATSPQQADGAALVVVASLEAGKALGLTPRARVASYVALASEPVAMLTGPGPATLKALARAGRRAAEVDVFEHNESFAATQLRFERDVGVERGEVDAGRINPHGGALALGHPLGATGGMLVGSVVDTLDMRDAKLGVVAMCAGAGLAAAMVLERV